MLLENKRAVVYGGAGAIGSAVACEFARQGARVFLAGRTRATLDAVAEGIVAGGGAAQTAEVDALDEQAVERHADAVVETAGRIDVSFNAIALQDVQLIPFVEMAPEEFIQPIRIGTRTNFLTARAAGRRMAQTGSGVILTLSSSAVAPPNRTDVPVGGFGVACTAIEAMTAYLAAELGPAGIRVVCLRPEGMPESWAGAATEGWSRPPRDIETQLKEDSPLRRVTTLADLADVAAFMASDRAAAMTGTVANVTSGTVMD